MSLFKSLLVKPGTKVKLSDYNPSDTGDLKEKADGLKLLEKNVVRMAELQNVLSAECKRSLLIVLQAMDAGGKDGAIRQVMSGLNPQSCKVTSFKSPSGEELSHDFLWRVHKVVPAKGEMGIFNRSHYEDVLVARVHNLVPESVWSRRYEQINHFEELLAENNATILKFFLHISKDEQKERLEERLQSPEKNWKVNLSDFEDRKHWNDYMEAYEDVITRCNGSNAPWFIIPANKKWYRNVAISTVILQALEDLDMRFPPPPCDLSKIVIK